MAKNKDKVVVGKDTPVKGSTMKADKLVVAKEAPTKPSLTKLDRPVVAAKAPAKGSPRNADKPVVAKDSPAKASSTKPVKASLLKKLVKPKSPTKMAVVDSMLRMTILPGYIGAHIENVSPITRNPYTEYLLWNAVTDGSSFMQEYDPDTSPNYLHVDNVIKKHHEGSPYHIRYLLINAAFDDSITHAEKVLVLRELAQVWCDNVNEKMRDNGPKLIVPESEEEFIYKPRENMVVSDVIGREGARYMLLRTLGENFVGPFEDNKEYIYRFFRSGEIHSALRTFLSAPDTELLPV